MTSDPKEIEMRRDQYARLDHKSGKMVKDISPRRAFWMMVLALGIVGFIFWNRDGFHNSAILVGCTAAFAFGAGGFFANWLKDTY